MWAAFRLLAESGSPITIFRSGPTLTVQVLAITEEDLLREANSRTPNLVVLDLASSEYDPFSCAGKLKTMTSPPKILAIFPHIRSDLKLRAEKVMIDYIVPNSSFLKTLKSVIEKEVQDA
jgi:PleD family two-component response regulator